MLKEFKEFAMRGNVLDRKESKRCVTDSFIPAPPARIAA